jgi:hypothetical protein
MIRSSNRPIKTDTSLVRLYARDAGAGFSPPAIHGVHNFGDNIAHPHHNFVDKAVVALADRRIQFVSPEGAGENRRNRAGE